MSAYNRRRNHRSWAIRPARWRVSIWLLAAAILVLKNGVLAGTSTVAISNTPAPGTAAGVTFEAFDTEAALNDAGQVAFRASLAGTGVNTSNDTGIWRGAAGSLTLAAREGTNAPGTSAGVLFSLLSLPKIDNAGQVAFHANLSGATSTTDTGIWAGSPGAIQLAAREGSIAPGTSGGVTFGSIFEPILNDSGQLAFTAFLSGSGTTNQGIWRGTPASLQLAARKGDAAAGTVGGAVYGSLHIDPSLNDLGQIAFFSTLGGPSVDEQNNEGIWRGSPGAVQLAARSGSPAAGLPSSVTYTMPSATIVALNNAGQVAFNTELIGDGVDQFNNAGVWSGLPGALQLVARTGNAAPGTPAGITYRSLGRPSINESGQVVFAGELFGSGLPTDDGIWRGTPGSVQLVARSGRAAPGAASGVTLSQLFFPDINNGGQVAFESILTGPGVNASNDEVLYLGDQEELLSIVREGQALAGSTVESFQFWHNDRGHGGLNNFGQFAYQATLTDGREGIFLFTPEIRWRRNTGGSWSTAGNWTASIAPGAPHDVKIDPAASLTVLGPTGQVSLKSLAIGGGTGVATLRLQQGGGVTTPFQVVVAETGVLTGDGSITGGVSNSGTVIADNLTIQGGSLSNSGVVTGSGRINGALLNSANGDVRVAADQHLHFTGPEAHASFGRVEVIDGEAEFDSLLVNEASGFITGRNARLRFGDILSNLGTVGFSFGTSDVFGDIQNQAGGKIILSGGSNATFYDNVVNNGELRTSAGSTAVYFGTVSGSGTFTGNGKSFFEGTFSPGNSPAAVAVEGDLAMGAAGTLLLEIGGATAGSQYDQLQVGGVLQAAGELEVRLVGDFTPSFGESFDLLTFGSRRGWFDSVDLPMLTDGLSWRTVLTDQNLSLTVVPEPGTLSLCVVGLLVLLSWLFRTAGT